jgi:hypothetical protein
MPKNEEEQPYFVTTDARMRDGTLDPDDEAIVRGMKVITPQEAVELAQEEESTKGANAEPAPEPELPADEVRLTPEMMEQLAGHAGEAMHHYEDLAEAIISRMALAPYVRTLRIEERCTWRAVARTVHERVAGDRNLRAPLWEPLSNQIMGMALCKVAAETHDQDFMEPPWN